MRNITIKVMNDRADGSIAIGVSGALYTIDNMGEKDSINFWLPKDKAEKLAKFIQDELQDNEMVLADLENQKLKYGGEDTYYGEDR